MPHTVQCQNAIDVLITAFYKKQKNNIESFFSYKNPFFKLQQKDGEQYDIKHASHAFVWARLCPSRDSMADLAAESAPTCHVNGSAGDGRNGAVA